MLCRVGRGNSKISLSNRPNRAARQVSGAFVVERERCKAGRYGRREEGRGRIYTRNDRVMGCEVGFAGFASKDFVRIKVNVVGEAHGCGDTDFAVVVCRSR